jgi:hypothetical protein
MKTCSKCKITKTLVEFHRSKTGSQGRNAYCKICSKEKAYTYFKANVQKSGKRANQSRIILTKLVEQIKEKYGCSICGEKEGCCLDFHHINDDKNLDIGSLAAKKKRREIFEEINKCIVVCANCHRKIHRGIVSCDNIPRCVEDINEYFDIRYNRYYLKK